MMFFVFSKNTIIFLNLKVRKISLMLLFHDIIIHILVLEVNA